MDNLNIIITGASQGIGFEVARLFAAQGNNHIFAIARNADKLKDLKNACIKENILAHLHPIAFDLSTPAPLSDTLFPQIRQHTNRIDILINNAGCLYNKGFEVLTDEEMHEMVQVNFLSAAKLIRATLPLMQPNGGHVVSIGSMGGFQGSAKFNGLSGYSASKAAIASLTECLAEEYRESRIRFNCLSLGAVDTPMFRTAFPALNAPKSAEEIAKFIVDFASTGNKYFNGKILPVSTTTP